MEQFGAEVNAFDIKLVFVIQTYLLTLKQFMLKPTPIFSQPL